MMTPAQREAVARVLFRREFPNVEPTTDQLMACGFFERADEIIAAYEAAAPKRERGQDVGMTPACWRCKEPKGCFPGPCKRRLAGLQTNGEAV